MDHKIVALLSLKIIKSFLLVWELKSNAKKLTVSCRCSNPVTRLFIQADNTNTGRNIEASWLIIMATPDDIKNILGSNEKVELYIEEKIYHPRINIESVIITNERIILRHPHALGLKKDYTDYSYRDITNVTLDKGIMRSTIKLTLRHREEHQEEHQEEEHLELDNLPNSLAEKGYGVIRENIGKFQSPFSTGYANAP
jgi:hypothetical protein